MIVVIQFEVVTILLSSNIFLWTQIEFFKIFYYLTVALSMPIPKQQVAAITGTLPEVHCSWADIFSFLFNSAKGKNVNSCFWGEKSWLTHWSGKREFECQFLSTCRQFPRYRPVFDRKLSHSFSFPVKNSLCEKNAKWILKFESKINYHRSAFITGPQRLLDKFSKMLKRIWDGILKPDVVEKIWSKDWHRILQRFPHFQHVANVQKNLRKRKLNKFSFKFWK